MIFSDIMISQNSDRKNTPVLRRKKSSDWLGKISLCFVNNGKDWNNEKRKHFEQEKAKLNGIKRSLVIEEWKIPISPFK